MTNFYQLNLKKGEVLFYLEDTLTHLLNSVVNGSFLYLKREVISMLLKCVFTIPPSAERVERKRRRKAILYFFNNGRFEQMDFDTYMSILRNQKKSIVTQKFEQPTPQKFKGKKLFCFDGYNVVYKEMKEKGILDMSLLKVMETGRIQDKDKYEIIFMRVLDCIHAKLKEKTGQKKDTQLLELLPWYYEREYDKMIARIF